MRRRQNDRQRRSTPGLFAPRLGGNRPFRGVPELREGNSNATRVQLRPGRCTEPRRGPCIVRALRARLPAQRALLTSLGLLPRYAEVVGGRLELRTGTRETLDSLARGLNVTRERIRQMELRALARIRNSSLAMEIELREPEILVRLRLLEVVRSRRRRLWSVRRGLLRRLELNDREREILHVAWPYGAAPSRATARSEWTSA